MDSHGNTKRENLENVARQIRQTPKELENLVELPESMKEYWTWFIRLSNRRPAGMGISSIPYSEMQAFFELTGVTPDPIEIEIIEAFDKVAMKYYSDQQKKRQDEEKRKAKK